MELYPNKFLQYLLGIEEKSPFVQLTNLCAELTVNFQPIFHAKTGDIFGYEALTRHISKKINIKKLFLDSKQNGTEILLDMMCRRNAIKYASKQAIDSYLLINTCAETLLHFDYTIDMTDKLIEEYNISKERIIFEITEETAIDNYDIFIRSILFYKKRGYKIAIDDFGAGFGGPKLMSLIEPDIVKIDKHFIANVLNNHYCKAFIEFTLSECHKRDIKVVAEGIETYLQMREMISIGIDFLQGHYLGKPSAEIQSLRA
ncbi:MAG: EAL domain-containing protein [Thermodesulfovibrionales bacterium]|nr:EAL domain-containing protein [Thermodesulfovibrionales bacterium]